MAIHLKRTKVYKERINLMLDEETKQHLYNVSENTGTAVSEIIRQAIRNELKKHKQHKPAEHSKQHYLK